MTNLTPEKTPPTPPVAERGLSCLACGYNLTGLCSAQSPTGWCPECGEWFVRAHILEQQRERAAFPMSLLIVQLLLFPIIIIFLPLFCVASLLDAFFVNEPSDAVMATLFFGVPLAAMAGASWLIARQYYPRSVAGIPPEKRRGLRRHIVLPWLLFFVIEFLLTAVYLIGGCAAILAALGYL